MSSAGSLTVIVRDNSYCNMAVAQKCQVIEPVLMIEYKTNSILLGIGS